MNDRVLDALQKVPGVGSAALTSYVPMTGWYRRDDFTVEGKPTGAYGRPQAIPRLVSASYFHTLDIPLLRGRLPDAHDTSDSPLVAVITAEMARRYWPSEDPLGKRLRWADGPNDPWITVAGVVGDVHEDGLNKPPQAIVYLPLQQQPLPVIWIVLRTRSDPALLVPAVRRALHAVHPKIPLYRIRRMDDVVLDSTWQLRYSMLLLSGLATLSLLLAVIGVYGVLSYAVTDRTREIGVRMSLGARRSDVVGLVVRRGLGLVALGIASGAAAAAVMTRFLSALLFGISPLDPSTFALVAFVLVVSGWLACYLPALRASRVNPAAALRHE